MGCGCGKSKSLNKQSSRMPSSPARSCNKKIEGVPVSPTMNSVERKVALTKIKNIRQSKKEKSMREFWEKHNKQRRGS